MCPVAHLNTKADIILKLNTLQRVASNQSTLIALLAVHNWSQLALLVLKAGWQVRLDGSLSEGREGARQAEAQPAQFQRKLSNNIALSFDNI